jgi:hypothetical protein
MALWSSKDTVATCSGFRALPHSEQNLLVAGFSAEQAGQSTMKKDYTARIYEHW